MNYKDFAKKLLQYIAPETMVSLTHCVTRLRFVLKENSLVDKESIKKIEGVIAIMESGGQLQIIVGTNVNEFYNAVLLEMDGAGDKSQTLKNKDSGKKLSILESVFTFMSQSFSPLIGALAGAGMLKGLLVLFEVLGWLNTNDATYHILSAVANAVFYFLPVLLGFSAANALKLNPFIGALIGASLLEPGYMSLMESKTQLYFLGIPVFASDYSSTVVPILFAILFLKLLDKPLNKIIPQSVKLVLVPFCSLIIVVPLTILVFGPFGLYVGKVVSLTFNYLYVLSPIITGFVLGSTWIILVIFGLHWALVPVFFNNLALYGQDFMMPLISGVLAAQVGVALGMFLKTKNANQKSILGASFLTALFSGVTEPIVYGILLRYKKTFIPVFLIGGISGSIIALLKVRAVASTLGGVLGLPAFITYNFVPFVLLSLTGVIIATIMTYYMKLEEKS